MVRSIWLVSHKGRVEQSLKPFLCTTRLPGPHHDHHRRLFEVEIEKGKSRNPLKTHVFQTAFPDTIPVDVSSTGFRGKMLNARKYPITMRSYAISISFFVLSKKGVWRRRKQRRKRYMKLITGHSTPKSEQMVQIKRRSSRSKEKFAWVERIQKLFACHPKTICLPCSIRSSGSVSLRCVAISQPTEKKTRSQLERLRSSLNLVLTKKLKVKTFFHLSIKRSGWTSWPSYWLNKKEKTKTEKKLLKKAKKKKKSEIRRRSGQSVKASDFGSNGSRFESGRGRCVESLGKALYSHCPKEKPSP